MRANKGGNVKNARQIRHCTEAYWIGLLTLLSIYNDYRYSARVIHLFIYHADVVAMKHACQTVSCLPFINQA